MTKLKYNEGMEKEIMTEIQKFFEYGAKESAAQMLQNTIKAIFDKYRIEKKDAAQQT